LLIPAIPIPFLPTPTTLTLSLPILAILILSLLTPAILTLFLLTLTILTPFLPALIILTPSLLAPSILAPFLLTLLNIIYNLIGRQLPHNPNFININNLNIFNAELKVKFKWETYFNKKLINFIFKIQWFKTTFTRQK